MDCDDTNPTVHPDAAETCNGVDDDCDTIVDEPDAIDATEWFVDEDGDGWGSETTFACAQPPRTAVVAGDCDDANVEIHPESPERCDGVDEDCDDVVDDACALAPQGSLLLADAQMTLWGPDPLCAQAVPLIRTNIDDDARDDIAMSITCPEVAASYVSRGFFVPEQSFGLPPDALIGGREPGEDFSAISSFADLNGNPSTDLLIQAREADVGVTVLGLYVDPSMGSSYGEAALRILETLPGWTAEEYPIVSVEALIPGADGPAIVVSSSWWRGDEDTDNDTWVIDGNTRGETSQTDWPLLGPEGHLERYASQYYPRDAGDLDGDGNNELALFAQETLHIYYGPLVGGEPREPDVRLCEPGDDLVGQTSLTHADLDGDGRVQLLVATNEFYGVGSALASVSWDGGTLDPLSNSVFAVGNNQGITTIAPPADIDGDGFLDLALAGSKQDAAYRDMGAVWIAYGPFEGVREAGAAGDAVIWGTEYGETLGDGLAAGDFNGDDYADVVIGNSWGGRDDHPGLLGLFFGGPRP